MHKLLSLITLVIGLALLAFMIIVEDEPGALPLALILIGIIWFFFTQSKIHSQQM